MEAEAHHQSREDQAAEGRQKPGDCGAATEHGNGERRQAVFLDDQHQKHRQKRK
jgi:hypothetical protein